MADPVVTTTAGELRGRSEEGVAVFRGIPFAAPPTGTRRFAPPVPPDPWSGVADAGAFGPRAPQNPSLLEQMLGAEDEGYDEDCLRLNVWAPEGADGLPIMMWIHGGAFETGTGAITWYDGSRLARRGVVVVTINYRLGALGFLHLAPFADGFEGSGNVGLLDQVAALQWVRDNAAAFGGDPNQVCIFGESAGAMSVASLLAVPAASGLFGRAILQSGAAAHVHEAPAAEEVARIFLAEVGVEPGDVGRLRELPIERLLAAQQRVSAAHPFAAGLAWQPVADGVVLPDLPERAVGAGSAAGVELIVGTTLEEMKMFLVMDPTIGDLDEDQLLRHSDKLLAARGRRSGEGVLAYRGRLVDAAVPEVWTAMLTDHHFRMPAITLAERQLAHHDRVWMYLFAFRSPAFGGALGSCHALEIPFVWDNLLAPGADRFVGEPTAEVRALADAMADAWVAFARDGAPAADGLPAWPAYDFGRRATMWFDAGDCRVVDDPFPEERQVWQHVDATPSP